MAFEITIRYLNCVPLLLLIISRDFFTCHGFGTFGFDFHHRFSDPVKGVLTVEQLPLKGTADYYAAMSHRDRIVHLRRHGRGLADQQLLTFSGGNSTVRIDTLGFLHYANVSVGTPSKWFLVALDTGSDLFWVPCDCTQCVKSLKTRSGASLELNIYSLNESSTSKSIPCNSSSCVKQRQCSGRSSACSYQVQYLSNNTSSSGILVEDILHMTAEGNPGKNIDALITLGCGQVETGSFLDGAAPNGLFGLGMDKSSVPSILSAAGIAANSFSMCFGHDGIGRITFGNIGNPNQDETRFSINQSHPTYNISVTQITVETIESSFEFSAIFDSGTSFTYLNDPAYTQLSKSFDSSAVDKRLPSDPAVPFEYCYSVSPNETILVPNVTLTMKGGALFPVLDPIIVLYDERTVRYCLGIVKSSDVNIIGQNFMTGYNIIFDRERMVLGWKMSNCYDIQGSSTSTVVPPTRNAESPMSTFVPPATAAEPRTLTPEATRETRNSSQNSGALQPSAGILTCLNAIGCTLLMVFLPFMAFV